MTYGTYSTVKPIGRDSCTTSAIIAIGILGVFAMTSIGQILSKVVRTGRIDTCVRCDKNFLSALHSWSWNGVGDRDWKWLRRTSTKLVK
jgi:hypothetical protein